MRLRVTRPGFLIGIAKLAESAAPTPHLPSVERWRAGDRAAAYDPNRDASRQELRSFVCGQCHVEYYCSSKMPLTFPWGKGFKAEEIEAYWNETKFPDGSTFSDYSHVETGAPVLKAHVRRWLMQRDEVLAFAQARAADGGAGAVVVLLRPSQGAS